MYWIQLGEYAFLYQGFLVGSLHTGYYPITFFFAFSLKRKLDTKSSTMGSVKKILGIKQKFCPRMWQKNQQQLPKLRIYPFKPQYLYSNSPYWSPYISLTANWENLLSHQDNASLVIILPVLMTFTCYNALIWCGEIWWWSLLGLKELIVCNHLDTTVWLYFIYHSSPYNQCVLVE